MKLRIVKPEELHQGFDRQQLSIVHKRFAAINMDRLKRLRDALSERQQRVLDALPLLFHTNHPMMPGFVSRVTPSRLANYKLTKDQITLGRSIARSFTPNIDISHPEDILAIYVMGSVGTIAQSEKSDLDIWLCFRPGLPRKAIETLNRKCECLSEWAWQVRLEVHFFLMDNQAFKQGRLSALNEESSGSAQRLLLLDEFYRTAIHIGGRKPLWWFVPSEQENNYVDYSAHLLEKRFIREDTVLDFGGIATIPDGEFVGAGIWQLYKAIESPYKSALKLLLLEAYAHRHPNITPLSLSFKSQVFNGEMDINELDSYVMIYRHIEEYLMEQNQPKRLELARRCFYFKVNKPLSKPPRAKQKSWQRQLLEKITSQWGWTAETIELLDQRANWKAPQVANERSLLVSELNHSYRFIQEFANETGAVREISTEEITVLGRKLQAAFERKPGKIEWINPGISSDLSEPIICLTEVFDHDAQINIWTAFSRESGTPHSGKSTAVKSSVNMVELLLWCYFNGVIDASTYIDLQNTPSLSEFSYRKLLNAFQQWLPLPLPQPKHDTFNRASAPTKVLMLLNVGTSPTPHLDEQGIQRLSSQGDALRYSGFEENLCASVDFLSQNSWQEINTRRFDGSTALLEALQEYLQLCLPASHQEPPVINVECIGSQHAATIATRVRHWFSEIIRCYYSGRYPSSTRYIFEMAGHYHSLQFRGPRLLVKTHVSIEALMAYLGEEQLAISPIMIDSRALTQHPLRTIAGTISGEAGGRGWSGAIHIFYQRFDIGMQVTIVDEMGAIIQRAYRGNGKHTPLKPLHRFLRAIIDRQTRMNEQLLYDFGIFPVHFYELSKIGAHLQAFPKRVSSELPTIAKFVVKAIAHPQPNNTMVFDFSCDNQQFSGASFGQQLYLVVAQHILKLRHSNENYPVYITDLDLSLCATQISENGRLSTSHYLKIKNRLEFKLNEAIGILLKNP